MSLEVTRRIHRSPHASSRAALVLLAAACAGCATARTSDTARTAIEQLLISNAIDQTLARVDFAPMRDRSVYVQEKYLDGVDKNYVAASVRQRVLSSGAKLVDAEKDADIVLELRSGGIGTDRTESFIGVPHVAAPGPIPVQIPEIQLVNNKKQTATAKIGIVAYDAKTRHVIGDGGTSLARAEDNNWFFFGAGPYNSGQVKDEVTAASGQSGVALQLARYLPAIPFGSNR
ncbi:MAG: hypothetical protein FJ297_18265 [Planctomycetes bacterium]|nr:hypothetical protein [Planctomycetota bacterium]